MTEEQRAELEKLARAAGPKRWYSFGGDTVHAVMCARTHKEVVMWNGFDASRTALTHSKRAKLVDFISACDPATVLDLLATIARLEAEAEAHRELTDAAGAVQIRLNRTPAMQSRVWDDIGIRFVNAINASQRLSSRAKDQSQ